MSANEMIAPFQFENVCKLFCAFPNEVNVIRSEICRNNLYINAEKWRWRKKSNAKYLSFYVKNTHFIKTDRIKCTPANGSELRLAIVDWIASNASIQYKNVSQSDQTNILNTHLCKCFPFVWRRKRRRIHSLPLMIHTILMKCCR